MADIEERLARLRGAADDPEAGGPIEQFRADFKSVWKWRRHCGDVSEVEMEQGRDAAAKQIRERMGDKEWIDGEARLYAAEAEAMRRDIARSERIKAEMAEQEKA